MRWLGFLIRLVLLIGLAVWLTDQPGTARLVWQGYIIETSATLLIVFTAGLAYGLFLLYRFWRFLHDGPRFWKLRRKLQKMHQGQHSLAQGFIALSAGDASEAGRLAITARKALGQSPTTRLLQAQAAQLAGDDRAAQEIYLALASDAESAPMGYRGLIIAALRQQNYAEAERLVEKLRRIRPETPWLNLIEFSLLTRQQKWGEASAALKIASNANLIHKNLSQQHRAALLLAEAQQAQKQAQTDRALQYAEQAARLQPEWLPATLMLAELQIEAGHHRSAQRLIERAWHRQPHPDLAALLRALGKHRDDPLGAYKQTEKLVQKNADHTLSQFVLAEAALAADLWGQARHHLMMIISRKDATRAMFRLMARLERRETGDERAINQWLQQASEAPAEPRWLCHDCGGSHTVWEPLCPHCTNFNTLEWQTPGISRTLGNNNAIQSRAVTLLSEQN